MTNTNKLIATQRVNNILEKYSDARDDDSILYSRLLKEEYNCSDNMRYITLERRIKEGILPSRDLVTRLRRKLQQENENLRGELWTVRQNYANVIGRTI